jgi:hypothetical protein
MVVALCKLAEEGLQKGVASRIRNVIAPPSSFRASEVGTACARYLYHARVDWARKPGIDPRLAGIFAQGTDCEKAVTRDFLDSDDWVLEEGQVSVQDADLDLTGHIDGALIHLKTGARLPVEIKSSEPNTWKTINSFRDLFEKALWLRRWAAQILVYLYLKGEPVGLIIIRNKSTRETKVLGVVLDDWMDELVKVQNRIVAARDAMRAGLPPPAEPEDPRLCRNCWARTAVVCPGGPTYQGNNLLIADELAELAERIVVAKEARDGYESARKELRERLDALEMTKEEGEKIVVAGERNIHVVVTKFAKGPRVSVDVE